MVRTRHSKSSVDAVDPTTPSLLLRLHVELLEWIARGLDRKSFLNLRLTSAEMAGALSSLMGKRYFRELDVLLSDQRSMGRLGCILIHDQFRKAVTRIAFDLAVLREKFVDPTTYATHSLTNEHRTRSKPSPQLVHCRKEYAQYLHFRSLVREDLKDYFALLKTHEQTPTISFTASDDTADPITWGMPRLRKIFGWYRLHSDTQGAAKITQAMNETGFPVQEIYFSDPRDFDRQQRLQPWTIALACGLMPGTNPTAAPFAGLRRLELDIDFLDFDRWSADYQISSLHWLIAQASQLEHLCLVVVHNYFADPENRFCDDELFEALIEKEQPWSKQYPEVLSRIRHLELVGLDFPKSFLLDFVRSRRHTLRRLRLDCITDSDGDDDTSHPDIKEELYRAHGHKDFQLIVDRTYLGPQYVSSSGYWKSFKYPEDAWLNAEGAGVVL